LSRHTRALSTTAQSREFLPCLSPLLFSRWKGHVNRTSVPLAARVLASQPHLGTSRRPYFRRGRAGLQPRRPSAHRPGAL